MSEKTITLITEVEIAVDPSEIIDSLGVSDERLFMFIWHMLDDERIGVDVKQRLWRSLDEDLRDTGNHPDDEDSKS